MHSDLSATCPQFALSLKIGDVHLYVPDDDELDQLADLASRPGGVLPREEEHFVSWLAEQEPNDVYRRFITTARRHRDLKARPGWTLDLAVAVDGVLVATQSLAGFDQWPFVRKVGNSSWLTRDVQRRGIGSRARCAVLDLAFGRLGAQAAFSWALPANTASNAVSARLGYHVVKAADPGDDEAGAKYRLDLEGWQLYRPPALPQTLIVDAEGLVGVLAS